MKIIRTVAEMQRTSEELRLQQKHIGIVPTMGYLHDGHASLIRAIRQEVEIVVTSIFVNPTQFGPSEDFSTYPRDLARDEHIAQQAGTDIVFYPDAKEMYPDGFKTYVSTDTVATILEGKFRPTHFRGVTTVVAKLFNIVKPHMAIFGQKDVQQAFILRQMVRDLNFDVRVIIAPIVREPDGLALSSRNVYLNPQERKDATALFRSLKLAEELIGAGERDAARVREEMERLIQSVNPTQIDYIAFLDPDSFEETRRILPRTLVALAVRFGSTRLLDNAIVDSK
jgi:pantoate--beta-alanine ligase